MTWAWISAAPSKILRMRASHRMRDTGNSSAKPLPPWICTALSASAQATRAAEQLGHAGLEVAAAAGILLARGVIGELARDHDLRRHHGDLVGDAREPDDRPAELHAVLRVVERLLHRRLGDADGARRGLDARGFERLHQLLEAHAPRRRRAGFPPSPRSRRRRSRIPSCRDSRAPRSRCRSCPWRGTAWHRRRAAFRRAASTGRGGRPPSDWCAPAASSGRRAPDG